MALRKLRLTSTFMKSQTGKQRIAIYIVPTRRKQGNETWSVNRVFKNHAENEAEKLAPDLFLFFKKSLHEVKASGQHEFLVLSALGPQSLGLLALDPSPFGPRPLGS